ncbi:hypothetical protein GLOIN_2v1492525 [Rhizophagus irregularis DAOM 181602=DAOM 197198]|uniref:Uncharacterized protein n=1 Tax=Rhizophagus irregularis (strain DAOM 181602 / DAOM 197198 / MUCL 43194) TaxID=747089 RepID=A0A2P4QZL4_RHIID|nr:hypothetical protein GLOIN_2v1492525 [Rhizophagus irregularis DAOM 181602=DAOM 197198]POG83052.1 hypothetical protein GLOIN_2v1492525 [Rhizophagus irregularis DAOM 181602=DAOM 197198]GET66333.1 hypothetical protein GLOIN_2v1492525 [Rhizophagus irregularis DAOM 181602=DAOM 197198]|eukprot:XP_025189918.1 hypothetical protein GLOIN_2v1492525 [Rhizophagus irregularis DAOM 181602=DAOM 197198]
MSTQSRNDVIISIIMNGKKISVSLITLHHPSLYYLPNFPLFVVSFLSLSPSSLSLLPSFFFPLLSFLPLSLLPFFSSSPFSLTPFLFFFLILSYTFFVFTLRNCRCFEYILME